MIRAKNISFLNEIGNRPQLEDAIYPKRGKASAADRLFLVCDGVGGENLGEEASRIACEEFAFYFGHIHPGTENMMPYYIDDAQNYVRLRMFEYIKHHPEAEKMSTTLALAFLEKDSVFTAWCGDSRIYHIRNGKILWHSIDHSLVSTLVQQGEISEAEAKIHRQRNVITRSISAAGNSSQIDTYRLSDIEDGDQIMLCTDGVLEQIDEERLHAIAVDSAADRESLFMKYCGENTQDNFSLYFLDLYREPKAEHAKAGSGKRGKKIAWILLLALIVSFITASYWKNGVKQPKSTMSPVPIIKAGKSH